MLSSAIWLVALRIWVGLYWMWNAIDDRRKREDIAAQLVKCGSECRFSWYKSWTPKLLGVHATAFASLLPFATLLAGLLIISGIFVEAAMIYLVVYCCNLYAMGFISAKSLLVQLAPLIITGLSGSNQTYSLISLLPFFLSPII